MTRGDTVREGKIYKVIALACICAMITHYTDERYNWATVSPFMAGMIVFLMIIGLAAICEVLRKLLCANDDNSDLDADGNEPDGR